MSKKKTLAEEMYEQESKDIENAINTLNKLAEQKEMRKESRLDQGLPGKLEANVDQKAIVLGYLENAYSGAKMMDDVKMMHRLSRAILAFSYDGPQNKPTWEEMQAAYLEQ